MTCILACVASSNLRQVFLSRGLDPELFLRLIACCGYWSPECCYQTERERRRPLTRRSTVKRVSGVDFRVERAGPRAGDPAQIVANSDRARELLGWQPQFDDLTTIVTHALAW